jgi:hypothetical protein
MINPPTSASSSLTLTVTTDKSSYYIGDEVYIYGNLTLDNTTIQDGLVGLEADGPNWVLVVRTLPTGTTPSSNYSIQLIDVIACDKYGNPENNFTKKTLAYFNATVRNNDIEMRHVLITVNIYDISQTPLGVASFEGTVKENTTINVIMSIPIPETAVTGTATAYANAYSGWPRIGGKPYCPEKSKEFEIVNGGATTGFIKSKEQITEGNYNSTFKLSFYEPIGTYTIHVTSIYQGLTAINSTTFEVKVLGDANGDGKVGTVDLSMLGRAWDTSEAEPHNELLGTDWNPNCDFNDDTVIGAPDLSILGKYWGYDGS